MDLFTICNYLIAPLILGLAFFGSTFGLIVFSRPNLKKIGPTNIYKFLFAVEYFNLIILNDFLRNNFNIRILMTSNVSCKLGWMVYPIYMSLSPMLLVYISVERFVSIAYPAKRFLLRRENFQLIYFLGLIIYNCCFYLFAGFNTNIVPYLITSPNGTLFKNFICYFNNQTSYFIFVYTDFLNRVMLPFLLQFVMTLLLIRQIYLSRKKFTSKVKSDSKQRTLIRDVKISISIVSINFVYLSLSLPFSVIMVSNSLIDYNKSIILLGQLNFIYFCLEFYLMIAANSIVRNEFLTVVYLVHEKIKYFLTKI